MTDIAYHIFWHFVKGKSRKTTMITGVNNVDIVSLYKQTLFTGYYIMAGHAIVVVKDITLLFYHGNAVIVTLW